MLAIINSYVSYVFLDRENSMGISDDKFVSVRTDSKYF